MNKTILVTDGAGFIGSHCCVQLLQSHFQVIVLGNSSNSHSKVFDRIEQITKQRPTNVDNKHYMTLLT